MRRGFAKATFLLGPPLEVYPPAKGWEAAGKSLSLSEGLWRPGCPLAAGPLPP